MSLLNRLWAFPFLCQARCWRIKNSISQKVQTFSSRHSSVYLHYVSYFGKNKKFVRLVLVPNVKKKIDSTCVRFSSALHCAFVLLHFCMFVKRERRFSGRRIIFILYVNSIFGVICFKCLFGRDLRCLNKEYLDF